MVTGKYHTNRGDAKIKVRNQKIGFVFVSSMALWANVFYKRATLLV